MLACQHLRLMLIDLQDVNITEEIILATPRAGDNTCATHLAEIPLGIEHHCAAVMQIAHDIKGEIIGKERAEDDIVGLYVTYAGESEGVGLGKHLLTAVVGVSAVDILKEDRLTRRYDSDINPLGTHIVDRLHVTLGKRGDKAVRDTGSGAWRRLQQSVDAIGEIVCRAPWHGDIARGSDDMVTGDMAYACYGFHLIYVFFI